MLHDDWREQAKHIILSPGDMIVDIVSNQYGVLVEGHRKSSDIHNALYFWKINWSNNLEEIDVLNAPSPTWVEEQGLKLSILIGFYDLYQID
tara:strand:+ start:1324 stop:1599 length:276 start_codon:yes stop_codon:yes gene_type:complete